MSFDPAYRTPSRRCHARPPVHEAAPQPLEGLDAGLLHDLEHRLADVLRRHLELAGDVARHQRLQVAVAVLPIGLGEIVADARPDEEVLHARYGLGLGVQLDQRAVIHPEEPAHARVDARRPPAGPVRLGVGAGHLPHVGGGPAHVGDGALEALLPGQVCDLAEHAGLGAARHLAPLVLGDAAEGAAGRATAQDLDRPADLLQRRDVRSPVGWVRLADVRQLGDPVQLGGVGRRHGLVHHHLPEPLAFHQVRPLHIDVDQTRDELLVLARLFQDARKRAAKERLISEAAARIGDASNIENILQTTAQELERVLGGSEISIQFQSKE